jgi:superfamily II DNA helicase RecQ
MLHRSQLCSKEGIVRVVFATVAIGMGVDIRDIRQIIHIGPRSSVKAYFQETGRAGRDGKPSTALLYYNNRDIAKKRVGMQDDMRAYCVSNNALSSAGSFPPSPSGSARVPRSAM